MVDLIFNLLNFAIVIGIFLFLYIRVILPAVKQRIVQEELVRTHLHEEYQQLVVNEKHLEESTIEQESTSTTLLQKIQQWSRAVDLQEKKVETERRHRAQRLEEKLARQAQQYELNALFSQLQPRVIERLERSLKEQFSKESEGHRYVEELLKRFKS